MPKRWRLGFRNKLLLASLLCLFVPAAVTLYISNSNTEQIVRSQVIDNEKRLLEREGNYVSNLINTMVLVANYIQFDPGINRVLNQNWQRGRLDQTDVVTNLLDFKEITDKLHSVTTMMPKTFVTILMEDGQSFTNYAYNGFQAEKLYDKSWMREVLEQPAFELYWAGTLENYIPSLASGNPQVLTIARNLRTSADMSYAVILVSMDENQISENFGDGDTGQMTLLVSPDGTVVSAREKEQIGQTFAFTDRLGTSGESVFIEHQDKTYLLTAQDIPYGKYRLVSLSRYDQAVEQVSSTHRWSTAIQMLTALFFLLVMVVLVRQVTKPIIHLGGVAATVEREELGIRSGIRGSDEIGKLGRSFDHMLDRLEQTISQIKEEQELKRLAELAMLQSQINPHFLFNILNSIRLRVLMKGDAENAELLQTLSGLLRMTIQQRQEMNTLLDELHMLRSYVELLNFRQGDQVLLLTHCATEDLDALLPRFILQPIIENAYIHGLRQEGGTIAIRTQRTDGRLLIEIEDDGAGMTEEELQHLRTRLGRGSAKNPNPPHSGSLASIGLSNVCERLYLTFGMNVELSVESVLGEGTLFRINLPDNAGSANDERER
ncbi:sensor histidine kinase [Paenibacillus daejeonensis]|uniref:sensor histidine kinase n=1 Tax=Paenibacillus daejeonensis TaxID=135193 RepID=UPI000363E323|nr:sensor histidine kinase [Paenibacillus daejeonensis]